MPELTIATFNCAGMANPIRRAAFFDLYRRLPVQVILVQETHSKTEQEAEWAPRVVVFNSIKKTATPKNGVAIFLNDPNIKPGMTKRDLEGRMLAVDISTQSSKFHLLNTYAPTAGMPTKSAYFDSLYFHAYSNLPTVIAMYSIGQT